VHLFDIFNTFKRGKIFARGLSSGSGKSVTIGYSLYTVAFGIENLYEFALIDFGHVIFIFSVFVTSMVKLAERDKNPSFLLSLIKSPPIIGVLGGIVVGSF